MNPRENEVLLNLHNLVRAKIRGHPFLLAPVQHEFASFIITPGNLGDEKPDLELTLELGRNLGYESPSHEAARFIITGTHLLARWKVMLELEGSSLHKVLFAGNRLSRFIAAKWIVEPALRLKTEEKGALMVHAACLADEGKGILVAGPGGAGKTTWALAWAAAGHPFFGDDFCFMNQGRAYPYLTPLRMSLGSLLSRPGPGGMLSLQARLEIIARTIVRRLSMGRVKFYYKARPEVLFPDRLGQESVEVAAAVWLDPRAKAKINGPAALSPEDFAALAARTDREEMHGFGQPAARTGEAMEPGSRVSLNEPASPLPSSSFWKRHQQKILELLRAKPCYRTPGRTLPPPASLASADSLLEWLSS